MISKVLKEHIKKLHAPLKSEEELVEILKKRLTKKEYKILSSLADESDMKVLCKKLKLDEKRFEEVKTKALKKINFHDLKEELLSSEDA
jgi:FixJ family two-component response regulator